MKNLYKQLDNGRYILDCKCYLPSNLPVKKVILGVHGFCGDKESSMLSALASAVKSSGVALICFDFPAHGASVLEGDQLTIANCMSDLIFMADWCRREYPDAERLLFATSFGGYISLLCCNELNDFRYVLRAPAVTMPEHILLDLLDITAEAYEQLGVVDTGLERKMKLPYAFYEEMTHYSVMDQDYKQDMLVIHGDADDVVPHADIQAFCKNNPLAKLKVLPGADHRFKRDGDFEKVIQWSCDYLGIK